jgi:hypothetical protein
MAWIAKETPPPARTAVGRQEGLQSKIKIKDHIQNLSVLFILFSTVLAVALSGEKIK